jgi:hypothetical protein
MGLASRNATPSDLAAAGCLDDARIKVVTFEVQAPTATAFGWHRMPCAGRIVRIEGRQKTAASGMGAADSTTLQVRRNRGGTSTNLLDAVMTFAQADGANNVQLGVLDPDHADYSAAHKAIEVASGDILDLNVTAIQAGATPAVGLTVQVTILV